MIYRKPGETFETSSTAQSGLVGTIGVRLEDGAGGTAIDRTTAGITEHPAGSGVYFAVVPIPADTPTGQYVPLWDTGGVAPIFRQDSEYLTVNPTGAPPAAAPSLTGRYATVEDVRAYTALAAQVPDDADLQFILDRAERDVDSELVEPVPWGRQASGLKYDPTGLETWRAVALNRATCAQTEYRLAMGEDYFIRAQHTSERGPDFAVDGKLPYIGPTVYRELSGAALVATPGVGQLAVGGTIMSSSTGWVETN